MHGIVRDPAGCGREELASLWEPSRLASELWLLPPGLLYNESLLVCPQCQVCTGWWLTLPSTGLEVLFVPRGHNRENVRNNILFLETWHPHGFSIIFLNFNRDMGTKPTPLTFSSCCSALAVCCHARNAGLVDPRQHIWLLTKISNASYHVKL